MDNDFDVRYDLSSESLDNKRKQVDNAMLIGNNVKIELNYSSDDFKEIANTVYSNMNELGYFLYELPITRNMPHSEIITATVKTNSGAASEQFVILADEYNKVVYYDGKHDCQMQVEFIDERHQTYKDIVNNADLLSGHQKNEELKRAEIYKVETSTNYNLTDDCK